jgi:serine/threonine protein kinase
MLIGMDFLPGGNLRELIKRFGCLPEDWVRFYSSELVLAISHLHSLHVIYRDIKPHNIMIDARGHLILIDFGLSKQEISSPRGAMSLVGTPDYSAPEVLKTGVHQIETMNKRKKEKEKERQRGIKKGAVAIQSKPTAEEEAQTAQIGYGKAADW